MSEGGRLLDQLNTGVSWWTYEGSKTGLELYTEEPDKVSAVNRDLSLGDRIEASESESAKSR